MKMFYTIGEVADLLDLPTSTVRFWESQFDVLRPSKNQRGHRKFTTQDVENLKTIYHLVKEKGMTLEGAKRRLRSGPDEVRHDGEIMERLLGIRALLVEIRNELGEGEAVFEDTNTPSEPRALTFREADEQGVRNIVERSAAGGGGFALRFSDENRDLTKRPPEENTPPLSSRSERSESRDLLPVAEDTVIPDSSLSSRSERSESRDLLPVAAVSEGAAEAAPILVAEDTNCHPERSTQCAVEGSHSEDETLRQAQGDDSPPPPPAAPELPTVVEQTLF